jgi:hypothetical protein
MKPLVRGNQTQMVEIPAKYVPVSLSFLVSILTDFLLAGVSIEDCVFERERY